MSEELLRAAIVARLDKKFPDGAPIDDLVIEGWSLRDVQYAVLRLCEERVITDRLDRHHGVIYQLLPKEKWSI